MSMEEKMLVEMGDKLYESERQILVNKIKEQATEQLEKERDTLREKLKEVEKENEYYLNQSEETCPTCNYMRSAKGICKCGLCSVTNKNLRNQLAQANEAKERAVEASDETWMNKLVSLKLVATLNAGESREETVGCILSNIADERDQLRADKEKAEQELATKLLDAWKQGMSDASEIVENNSALSPRH